MGRCVIAKIKNGKLFVKISKAKKCKVEAKTAQNILDEVKTNKIIYK